MMYLGLFLSMLIGIVLGLVGGGGSILTVPLVHYFFGESLYMATTYSLFVVSVAGFMGVFTRIGKGVIDYRGGIVFVIPSMITAFLIRRFVMSMFPATFPIGNFEISRDVFISSLLIIVMLYTAYRTLFSSRPNVAPDASVGIGVVILFGVLTGLLSGFIGAGGGFIIVPILLRMGMQMKKAVGTSMFIVAIQSAVALLGDFTSKNLVGENTIDWTLLLLITLLTVIGVVLGGYLQRYFTGKALRKVFAWLLVVVAVGMAVQFIVA